MRHKFLVQEMTARFPAGTFEAIADVLNTDEDRADFVRLAVAKEVTLRKRKKKKPPTPPEVQDV